MLKALALALGLGLAGLAGSVAQAEPLFDAYQALCVKTGAEAPAVISGADGSGWMAVPDALLLQLSNGAQVEDAQGRMRSGASGIDILIVGHKSMPIAGANMDVRFCAVATTAPSGDALKSAMAAWAGVAAEPALAADGRVGYIFADNSGVHTVVSKPSDAQAKDLLKSGHVMLAFIQEAKGLNLLAFAVPKM